jgi:hypothetical protein
VVCGANVPFSQGYQRDNPAQGKCLGEGKAITPTPIV